MSERFAAKGANDRPEPCAVPVYDAASTHRRHMPGAQEKMVTRVQTAREEARCAADFDYGAPPRAQTPCTSHLFVCVCGKGLFRRL